MRQIGLRAVFLCLIQPEQVQPNGRSRKSDNEPKLAGKQEGILRIEHPGLFVHYLMQFRPK